MHRRLPARAGLPARLATALGLIAVTLASACDRPTQPDLANPDSTAGSSAAPTGTTPSALWPQVMPAVNGRGPGGASIVEAATVPGDTAPFYFLLMQNRSTGDRAMLPMEGTVQVGGALLLPREHPDWEMVGGGDFDGDGMDDIVFQNLRTGQRGLWKLRQRQWTAWLPFSNEDTTWHMVSASDFTGDRNPDILFENQTTGERGWWVMKGAGYAAWLWMPQERDPEWRMVGAADFTGDGKPDMLLQHRVTGQRGIWELDGARWMNWTSLTTEDPAWEMVAIHDVNADGHPDILFQHRTSGARGWWLMNRMQFRGFVPLGTIAPEWDIVGPLFAVDNSGPSIFWIAPQPQSVDLNGGPVTVRLSARLTDAVPGVARMLAELIAPDGTVAASCTADTPFGSMLESVVLACDVTLTQAAISGSYTLRVRAWDRLGNMSEQVNPGSVLVRGFDDTPPVLDSLRIAPREVDVTMQNQVVGFTAWVRDAGSTIFPTIEMTVTRPDGAPYFTANLEPGRVFTYTIRRSDPAGTYTVSMRLRDHAGNVRVLSSANIAAAGFPSTITVIQRDVTAPTLTSLVVPDTLVVSGSGAYITSLVGARDDLAGLRTVFVTFRRAGATDTSTDRVSEISHAPQSPPRLEFTFQSSTFFWAASTPAGQYEVVRVEVSDYAGNTRVVLLPELQAMGLAQTVEVLRQ